ncbi:endonuclease [Marinovum sp.]|uniref:endonuclease n=1 Tax=Marinovum sp. TaxID=2024839 RepID=UPI003A9377B8
MIRPRWRRWLRRLVLGLLALVCLLALALGVQHLRLSARPALVPPPPGALRVATHNVHYIITRRETGPWSLSDWERRKPALDAAFKALRADLVAFQEMESFSGGSGSDLNLARDWLLQQNPGYAAAATGPWQVFPPTQPILYRRDRLELLDQGWFFFSETPKVIYSRTFNGSWPAFASWAEFRDRQGGAAFRVLNVHLDYSSLSNRRKSVALIRDRLLTWRAGGHRVMLFGDLNAWRGAPLLRPLERAGVTFLPVRGATYHLNRGLNLLGAIDHIALGEGIRALGVPMVLRERVGRVLPSEHYPVVADVAFDG